MNKEHLAGYGYLLSVILFSGILYILGEYLLGGIDIFVFLFYFFFSAAVISTPFCLLYFGPRQLGRVLLDNRFPIFKILMLAALGAIAWFSLLAQAGATGTAFYTKLEIPFSILLGVIFLSERLRTREWVGIFFVFAGISVMSAENVSTALPLAALGVASAIFWSAYSMEVKRHSHDFSLVILNFFRIWSMAIIGFFICLILGKSFFISQSQLLLTALNGVVGAIGLQTAYLMSHRYLPISILNSVLAIVPLFVAVTAYFVFDQIPSTYKLVGGAVVLLGVFLISLSHHKRGVEVGPT
ncbi:MAG: DMT family transporter [bacterium]|nr:DMT family transporter [bacterium]